MAFRKRKQIRKVECSTGTDTRYSPDDQHYRDFFDPGSNPLYWVVLFSWLGYVVSGLAWVLAIVAIVMGFSGKTFRIPFISKLTDKYFKFKKD